MKKLLIILTILLLNTAFVMADFSITVDGKPVGLKEFDTGKNGTFLYKAELSTSADPSFYRYKSDKLRRGEITFQSQDYWFHESILIELEVDLEKGYRTDVKHYFLFDETIDMTKASRTDPLEVKFLGETLKIIGIISDNELTVSEGTEYFAELDVGDPFSVDGKTLVLENVGESDSVIVDVDGVKETIGSTPETVNGILVTVVETHYETTKAQRSAVLLVGKLEFLNHKNGDSFKEDPNWNWNLNGLNEKRAAELSVWRVLGPYFGIKNNPSWKSLDSGSCISMLNDYPTICIPELKDYFSEKEPEENEELPDMDTEEPTCKNDYKPCNNSAECCSQNCCENVCIYSKAVCARKEEKERIRENTREEEEENIPEEEPALEPVEEKKESYTPFTKRIFEWISSWFR